MAGVCVVFAFVERILLRVWCTRLIDWKKRRPNDPTETKTESTRYCMLYWRENIDKDNYLAVGNK